MTLRDLIARLEAEDQRKVCSDGFCLPKARLPVPSFMFAVDVTVGAMLAAAQHCDPEWLTSKVVMIDHETLTGAELTEVRLEERLAAGIVPGETEIEGWTFHDEIPPRLPAVVARGVTEGARVRLYLDGTMRVYGDGNLPLAVIDRLRAMWRERNGA